MYRKISAFLAVSAVILMSGCVGGGCDGCESYCSGGMFLTDGYCSSGSCVYSAEQCQFGCEDGAGCMESPPHLEISESPQVKGNMTLSLEHAYVIPLEGDKNDDYELAFSLENSGEGEDYFEISAISLLASTGILHDAEGFHWSEILDSGDERTQTVRIRDVPVSRREQNTTIIFSTNQGWYYFPTMFVS